jgi:hypothetical protein
MVHTEKLTVFLKPVVIQPFTDIVENSNLSTDLSEIDCNVFASKAYQSQTHLDPEKKKAALSVLYFIIGMYVSRHL